MVMIPNEIVEESKIYVSKLHLNIKLDDQTINYHLKTLKSAVPFLSTMCFEYNDTNRSFCEEIEK